ncbi:MAG: hypothetical protein FWF91_07225 [Coriobacteriia bacterium]|nr:hypothetical protein [Coriobacteriia bacterium]
MSKPKKIRNNRKVGKRTGELVQPMLALLKMTYAERRRAKAAQYADPNEHTYGYTVNDAVADKADRIMFIVGRCLVWWFKIACAVAIAVCLLALLLLLLPFVDVATSDHVLEIGTGILIACVAVPFCALWFICIPVGAIIGMQMVSRWGFLASVPFSVWVVGLSWPMVADALFNIAGWKLWTFPQVNMVVYLIGLAICVFLMVLIGYLSGASFRIGAESTEARLEAAKLNQLMREVEQDQAADGWEPTWTNTNELSEGSTEEVD